MAGAARSAPMRKRTCSRSPLMLSRLEHPGKTCSSDTQRVACLGYEVPMRLMAPLQCGVAGRAELQQPRMREEFARPSRAAVGKTAKPGVNTANLDLYLLARKA